MGFEPMPLSRRQLECRVLDRSTTVTVKWGDPNLLYNLTIHIFNSGRTSLGDAKEAGG